MANGSSHWLRVAKVSTGNFLDPKNDSSSISLTSGVLFLKVLKNPKMWQFVLTKMATNWHPPLSGLQLKLRFSCSEDSSWKSPTGLRPKWVIKRKDLLDIVHTPLKINMEHNHGGLEDHVPFKLVICRFHVNLPGCISSYIWINDTILQQP